MTAQPSLAEPLRVGGIEVGHTAEETLKSEIKEEYLTDVINFEFLGYRDSGMWGDSANADPRAFLRASVSEAARRLVRLLDEERPDVVVTYPENGGYGHPDHVKAHQVTV